MSKVKPEGSREMIKRSGNSAGVGVTGAAAVSRRWRWVVCFALLVAVAYLALRSSPNMQEIGWLPRELTGWADRHGHLRHGAGFALLSMVALTLLPRPGRSLSDGRKDRGSCNGDVVVLSGLWSLVMALELAQL